MRITDKLVRAGLEKMDRELGVPSSTLLSLTGYLDLQQKTWRGRQRRRYWFWFDEQTCHLKYYRNQEAYQDGVFEPLMAIDLRYAAVTPPMAAEDLEPNQFQINTEGQMYTLAAADAEKAHSWIKKLQEKREQWIHREAAAQGQTDLERQTRRRILQPLHERPGVLLPADGGGGEDKEPTSNVRKIMSHHMRLEKRHSSPMEKSPIEGVGYYSLSMAQGVVSHTPAEPAAELEGTERREFLELRHKYHASQEEVTKLQKELVLLKDRMAKKNEKIVQLSSDIDGLNESLAKSRSSRAQDNYELEIESLRDIIDQYKRSVQSLVDEIELKGLREKECERRVTVERVKVEELEREVNSFKAKFVTLLSDKFKVVVPNPAGAEDEIKDEEEANYQKELLQLIERESDSRNDFFCSKSSFKDEYGDWHDWQTDATVQHYLCRQLYLHYTQHERESLLQEWAEFFKPIRNVKGKTYPDLLPGTERVKRRELRDLLRKGVPIEHRTRVWSSLVYRLAGRMKEVKDNAAGSTHSYYYSLLESNSDNVAEKQILLDLHRTLPSNAHFRSKGYGSQKLKNVLVAYSHHNKNIGYCQGMNLIAAIALLFLDEETTFWFLLVVIEKLLPNGYFSPGLLGAQADQAVLRELLPQKLPQLSAHLNLHSIDVTLITFNWFLTLFIDAMPTESVLRILDCFLLEGPKILFRVGLGVLKVNSRHLLSITDPVTLFQTLKEIAKHTFDIDRLLKVAFTGMEPFPARSVLTSRHGRHHSEIQSQWQVRERELKGREAQSRQQKLKKPPALSLRVLERSFRETQKARRHLVWECGCVRVRSEGGREQDEVWVCFGDRHQGRLAIISFVDEEWQTKVPNYDVSSRVISVGHVSSDLVVLGTLDFNLHAFHCQSQKRVWSLKMPDSVLAIQSSDDWSVFAALADGFVAVLQSVTVEPPERAPLLVHIGSGAVTCLVLGSGQELWCGCGNAITILSSQNFEPVHSIAIEELKGKVYKMATSRHGVWVSFRSSSVVSLYEAKRYVRLLQVDYTTILPSDSAISDELDSRVTSLMVVGRELWVGTGKGVVVICSVSEAVAEKEAAIAKLLQSSSEAAVSQQPGPAGQGLLTPELDRSSEDTQSSKEMEDSPLRTRRTAFGRTLRVPQTRLPSKKAPAVFRLQFKSSHKIVQAESVRVLLSVSGGSAVVSCVNSAGEWGKGVQGWTCKTDEWTFQHLAMEIVGGDTDTREQSGSAEGERGLDGSQYSGT